ncbi:MAG: isoprenyl transferase [Bacteroidales bacterium]|nr:isoprenyl transferase [Bacteroidales bacterium]
MTTLSDIDLNNIPRHVAIIMDGNGRWAKAKAQRRLYGHQHAIQAVHSAVEAAVECHVGYLTLYTFSTENWNRPQEEVDGLMELIVKAIKDETPTLMKNNVRLTTIGDIQRMPARSLKSLQGCIETTAANTGTVLTLALSYSSRWEIKEALKQIVAEAQQGSLAPESITEETLRNYLATKDYPDPDLLIRTGGELRTSNFLQWQMAYTEYYFTDLLWPDFRKEHFYEAVADYQGRQRRFGKTGDQVEAAKK